NEKAGDATLIKLGGDADIRVRAQAAANPNTPVMIQMVLWRETRLPDPTPPDPVKAEEKIQLKIAFANNEKTPNAQLATLAGDADPRVLMIVVDHRDLPKANLEALCSDPDLEVAGKAKRELARREGRDALQIATNSNDPAALDGLAGSKNDDVRIRVAMNRYAS